MKLKLVLGHPKVIPSAITFRETIVSLITTYLKEGKCFLGRIRRKGTPQYL